MKKAGFIAVLLFAFSAACASESASFNAANSGTLESVSSKQMSSVESNVSGGRGSGSGNGGSGGGGGQVPLTQQVSLNQAETSQNQPVTVERKIIRHADLNLEAAAPEESMTKITTITDSKGGFVVESQQNTSDVKAGATRDIVTMTVRVPAARFNETLDEIRKTASRVIVETVKGEDVTEEFIDIEARLKTERALEQQFLEIMKQVKSVQEALNVQRELATVRGGIEKIEGRRRFLENQSSLSTIKIRLQTPTAFSANSTGFSSDLGRAFGRGFDTALSFILGLVTVVIAILPFLLLVVLPLALVIRYFLKRQRRQKQASEIAREEIKSNG